MGRWANCCCCVDGVAVAIAEGRRRRNFGMDGGEFGGVKRVAVGMGAAGDGVGGDVCGDDRDGYCAGEINATNRRRGQWH